MEVTKKEERGEHKKIKRPEIESAIIEELISSLSFCNWKDRKPVAAEKPAPAIAQGA